MSKALAIEYQVRLSDHFQANRGNFLTLSDGVLVMVPEQMQAWLHGCQHLVDGRLPRVDPADGARSAPLFERKWPRGFVRQKHIDAAEALAGLDLLAHEMPPLVVFIAGAPRPARRSLAGAPRPAPPAAFLCRAGLADLRRVSRTTSVRRCRPGPPESGRSRHRDAVGNVVEIGNRAGAGRLRCDEVEILVVAFDPIQRRAGRRDIRRRRWPDRRDTARDATSGWRRHDAIKRFEVAVKIADGTKQHHYN